MHDYDKPIAEYIDFSTEVIMDIWEPDDKDPGVSDEGWDQD